MEGAARTALKQNSQLIKCVVKVGIKQMAGSPAPITFCCLASLSYCFSHYRALVCARGVGEPVIKRMSKWKRPLFIRLSLIVLLKTTFCAGFLFVLRTFADSVLIRSKHFKVAAALKCLCSHTSLSAFYPSCIAIRKCKAGQVVISVVS